MNKFRHVLLIGWFFLCSSSAFAQLEFRDKARLSHSAKTPFLALEEGGILEGSARYGGLQPDYLLDWEHEEFRNIRIYAEKLKDLEITKWEKVERLRRYVNIYLFPKYRYDDPDYLKVMKRYRNLGLNIPVSAYAQCGAGVCREHGIVMHFALREAGIKARYVYAKVSYDVDSQNDVHIEDHAFNVIKFKNQLWVVDSYSDLFHGFQLDDLMAYRGAHLYSRPAPGVSLNPDPRRIVRLHVFNAYQKLSCEKIFK